MLQIFTVKNLVVLSALFLCQINPIVDLRFKCIDIYLSVSMLTLISLIEIKRNTYLK